MAGLLFRAKICSRSARAALPVGTHWRSIDPDIHLGYWKQKRGGQWVVRWHAGHAKYRNETLGTADDIVVEGTLSFDQATKRARQVVTDARAAEIRAAQASPETVRSILESYIEMRDARRSAQAGRKTRSDAASRVGLHILRDPISDIELSSLTEEDLYAWKARLPPTLKPTSRLRTLSDFKSALNIAHLKNRKRLPPDFGEIVRYGLSRDEAMLRPSYGARHHQILGDDVVRNIISAAASYDQDGDIWRMILVLAATGARFSQVQRLQVLDLQCERSRLLMPTSRKGRNRPDAYYPVQIGADVVAALQPIVDGRRVDEPLLCRWRYVQTGIGSWQRHRRGPWTSASELTRPWKANARQSGSVGSFRMRSATRPLSEASEAACQSGSSPRFTIRVSQ
jgi:hypothetical protein